MECGHPGGCTDCKIPLKSRNIKGLVAGTMHGTLSDPRELSEEKEGQDVRLGGVNS